MAHTPAHHGDGCVHTSGALTPTPGAKVGTGDGNASVAPGTDATRPGVAGTHHSDTEGPPLRHCEAKQRSMVQSTAADVRGGERPSDSKREEDGEPADAPVTPPRSRSTTHGQGDDDATWEAGRLVTMSNSMASQGDFESAESLRREALAVLRTIHGDGDHPDVVWVLYALGMGLHTQGDSTRAKSVLREAIAMARRVCPGCNHLIAATVLSGLACAVRETDGATSEVAELRRERVAILRHLHDGKEHSGLVMGLVDLGMALQGCGDLVAAEAPLREAVAMARRLHKGTVDGHSDIVAALTHLGELMYVRQDPSHGEPQLREAVDMARHVHGGHDHSQVANLLSVLALALHELGDSRAEDMLREAVAMQGRLSGDRDECCTASCLGKLGCVLQAKGEMEEAELLLCKCVAMERRLHGDRAGGHAGAQMLHLAEVLQDGGKLVAAAVVLRDVVPLLRCFYGEDHDPTGQRVLAHLKLGNVLRLGGDFPGAERALRYALDLELRLRGGTTRVSDVQTEIVGCLSSALGDQARHAAAEKVLRNLLVRLRHEHGRNDNWLVALALNKLGKVLTARRDLAGAERLLFEALAMVRRLPVEAPFALPRSVYLAEVLEGLSTVLTARGNHRGAVSLLREVVAKRRRTHKGQDHTDLVTGLVNLGDCLLAQRDRAGALAALREAVAMARRLHKGQDHGELAYALNHLATGLHSSGDSAASLPLHREHLALLRRTHGQHDHDSVATSLGNVGVVLLVTGDVPGAVSLLRQSADMWSRLRAQPGRDREQDDVNITRATLQLVQALHTNGDDAELAAVMGKLIIIT